MKVTLPTLQHKLTDQLLSLPSSVPEPFTSKCFRFQLCHHWHSIPIHTPFLLLKPVFNLSHCFYTSILIPLSSHHPSSSTPVVNNSNELGPVEELALPANETSVTLSNLRHSTRYKFYLNAKTVRGAGPAVYQETVTIMDEGKSVKQTSESSHFHVPLLGGHTIIQADYDGLLLPLR